MDLKLRHRHHADKVSDEASDKERKMNPIYNSKMSELQSGALPLQSGNDPSPIAALDADSAEVLANVKALL
jgi:hypothetical protein